MNWIKRSLDAAQRNPGWFGAALRAPNSAADASQATAAPLLAADDIAQLAAQAALLADASPQREIHDHHAGDWPSAWLGRGLDYEESRPYAAGDDIRDMDWRTTARSGRPYLKIYREEHQPLLHLVVDRGTSLRFGTRRRLKAAQAARVACLLAFAAAQRNSTVGATLWQQIDLDLPPRHGRLGALALAQAVAAPCPPIAGAGAAAALRDHDRLARLNADLPRGARLLLASDFAWLDASHLGLLAQLAERIDVLAVQIVDPAEPSLPDIGLACFRDMAGGERRWLDSGRAATRSAHAAAWQARQAERAALLARAGVQHLIVGSEVDDLPALLATHA